MCDTIVDDSIIEPIFWAIVSNKWSFGQYLEIYENYVLHIDISVYYCIYYVFTDLFQQCFSEVKSLSLTTYAVNIRFRWKTSVQINKLLIYYVVPGCHARCWIKWVHKVISCPFRRTWKKNNNIRTKVENEQRTHWRTIQAAFFISPRLVSATLTVSSQINGIFPLWIPYRWFLLADHLGSRKYSGRNGIVI